MKKGKLLVGILIGIALDQFVTKNKWCQEKIQSLKQKGEEVLEKCKCQNQENEPAAEENKE